MVLVNYGGQSIRMDRLRQIRKDRGFTQEALAEASGVDQGTISKLERHGKGGSIDALNQIAEALNVSPAEFFEMPERYRRIIALVDGVPEESREGLIQLLEGAIVLQKG